MTKIAHKFCGICIQGRDKSGGIACLCCDKSMPAPPATMVCWRQGCWCRSFTAWSAIARHSLLEMRQGCWRHSFAAFSAAGLQRNILARRSGCFCIALRAIARHSRANKKRQPSRATAAGRHAPFPVSYTIRLPAGSICARNIIPWFCPLRKYKKLNRPCPCTFPLFF